MRSAYSKEYTDYVCVDALGKLYNPNFFTDHFRQLLKKHKLKKIRFHDLRLGASRPRRRHEADSGMLGHSDMSTTVNVRNPHTNETQVKAA